MSTIKYMVCMMMLVGCSNPKNMIAERTTYNEPHRLQMHFSPKSKWMNDPNGMLYSNGVYHLFYQHYPDSNIWGPMHWGHATSKDLVHWEHQPIALYPDTLGYIFSGSAVLDVKNTSGFGKDGSVPLVAIFTHHNAKEEKTGTSTYQNQSIAYSLDEGKTWTKYANNPVLKNPGIKDFRDPKVSWHEETKKWIMTLATLDRVSFFSSPDLKKWTKESEFGGNIGAHGGVWECPDLFPLDYNGKKIWVLLVSINPGGPNKGSATQYFTGEFDGTTFTPFQTDTRWIDYGPDNYAGITWFNTGNRKIFIGWMSNWLYANTVPTQAWRNAATVPRDLKITEIGGKFMIASIPVKELDVLNETVTTLQNVDGSNYDLSEKTGKIDGPWKLKIGITKITDFSITISNEQEEKIVVGYDKKRNIYFIDRSKSGIISFDKEFAATHVAPRISNKVSLDLTLIVDNSSIELFADDGLTAMTAVFFPNQLLSKIKIESPDHLVIQNIQFNRLNTIW